MSAKANTIQDKPFHKRYANKTDHNNKNKYKYNNPRVAPSNPIPRVPASNPSFKEKGVYFVCGKLMRIMKLAKYKQNAQVEKDEGPEAEALPRLLIVVEGPN